MTRISKTNGNADKTFSDPKTAELHEMLLRHAGEEHVVLLQDFPDPDAISCGVAYRNIASQYDITCDLVYAGRISHQENLALVNLLEIELNRCSDRVLPSTHYKGAVFVDNQGTTTLLTEVVEEAGIPVVAVVDHHVNQDRLHPEFMDLRPVGACASLFTNYLENGLYPLGNNSKPDNRRLATALMHGIISETGSMTRAEQMDFQAGAFLQPHYDPDLLADILNQKRSHKVMEVIQIALANRSTREGLCISGVGYIRSDDRDAIPQAVDFLITEETVHTAIVYGIVTFPDGRESIHGSLRTIKHTLSPDAFLKDALGRSPSGTFFGGGKAMAGGFEIPLGFLAGWDDPELAQLKWETYNAKVRKRLFAKIGVEDR